jgi:hypothetical protein
MGFMNIKGYTPTLIRVKDYLGRWAGGLDNKTPCSLDWEQGVGKALIEFLFQTGLF